MQSCGSKVGRWRRHLYFAMNRLDTESYPLCRIDSSTLFFPTDQPDAPKLEEARLPNRYISFTPSSSVKYGTRRLDFFALFGLGKNKSLIAGADENGFTMMYDLDQRTVHNQLRLNEPKRRDPISVSVGDSLYVMDRSPLPDSRGGFEALVYDTEQPRPMETVHNWRWHCLPPPPYVLVPGYKPTDITAYTVVGGSDIWVSTPGIGTYSYNTSTGKWRKAGAWALPFNGRADFYPEYNLWLGFDSSENGLLCSWNINAASKLKPALGSLLEEAEDMRLLSPEEDLQRRSAEDWTLKDSNLVHLGLGKFCVAKFFVRKDYGDPTDLGYKQGHILTHLDKFAVLTGFVMDLSEPGGELRMIKHKSRRYRLPGLVNAWVF